MDESYHFNTSRLVGLEVPRALEAPTRFERWVVNRGVAGCQRDHFHFSAAINGIFWYDPALYPAISPDAALAGVRHGRRRGARDDGGVLHPRVGGARRVGEDPRGRDRSPTARSSSRSRWLDGANREMRHMRRNAVPQALARNRAALARFRPS